jgi:hypothetical protein
MIFAEIYVLDVKFIRTVDEWKKNMFFIFGK